MFAQINVHVLAVTSEEHITLQIDAPVAVFNRLRYEDLELTGRWPLDRTIEFFQPFAWMKQTEMYSQPPEAMPHQAQYRFMATDVYRHALAAYEKMIADGVMPAQAEMVLPQGLVVRENWRGDIWAWGRLYNPGINSTLPEIRAIALRVSAVLAEAFPSEWERLTGVRD